jgi:5-methylcytosine-specific restriction endonuclease McrA
MSVLLLNATYEPHMVINLKRAIVLILEDKAEVIHESDDVVRSASLQMNKPEVIRLKTFVKVPYRARIPLTRRAVLNRDKGTCAYCKKPNATTIDHVVPRSKGGRHEWENVVAACRPCNAKKDDKTLEQTGWRLDFTPFAPKGRFWLIVGIKEVPQEWAPYLEVAM